MARVKNEDKPAILTGVRLDDKKTPRTYGPGDEDLLQKAIDRREDGVNKQIIANLTAAGAIVNFGMTKEEAEDHLDGLVGPDDEDDDEDDDEPDSTLTEGDPNAPNEREEGDDTHVKFSEGADRSSMDAEGGEAGVNDDSKPTRKVTKRRRAK